MDSPKLVMLNLTYKPVDFEEDRDLCFHFREDAWLASFGNLDRYSDRDTREWFDFLTDKCRFDARHYFMEHIWLDQKIIGQLEYQVHPHRNGFGNQAHINLIYIGQGFRQQGIGLQAHQYLITRFKELGCNVVHLHYIPQNKPAEAFYIKHGWKKLGSPNKKGQMMELKI
ncbi:GNAT family N-acetyltransferase [Pelagibaculum spongiae]|uniref:N-acetyltransferase domain-containing protein n=1 Tax=Pelagibaculum spongiae TaxID=2080658 RepID=A0A2V1GYN3_9GAMM|nr:GNAT family N-acetyltransferase [Pelagibaculum spongiae]PVZ67794.1 hypothetical protein DC094_15305 [Pelagibaculum spongiae]